MGCDIHVFLERKMGDGPWELENGHKVKIENQLVICGMPTLSARDYDFFAIVAGIRGGHKPLIKPRGMPLDVSIELAKEYDRFCNHTPTFLLPEELTNCLRKYEKHRPGIFISDIWSGKPEKTFQLDNLDIWNNTRLNNSSLLYIEREKTNNQLENMITGDNRELQFRYVIWFDS
jgi:hypothetical protein